MPESLLVIGGGYIGLEMGSVYAELGSKVTVVELTPTLLPGADRDLVVPLQAKLNKAFAAIHLETKVTSLTDKGERDRSRAGKRRRQPQRAIQPRAGVGRPPAEQCRAGTWKTRRSKSIAKASSSSTSNCEPPIRTSWPLATWRASRCWPTRRSHQGRVAIEALLGEPAAFEPHAIPAVVFTDPEIAWAGLTEEQAKAEGIQIEICKYPWAASGRAQALGRTEGFTKLLVDPETERVLGIGLVGINAGDLISEGVLAIEMGATVRDVVRDDPSRIRP